VAVEDGAGVVVAIGVVAVDGIVEVVPEALGKAFR
jgi:hypothetical protein